MENYDPQAALEVNVDGVLKNEAAAPSRAGLTRLRLVAEVNGLVADLESSVSREAAAKVELDKVLQRARAEAGTATSERARIQAAYDAARSRLLRTLPDEIALVEKA